VVEIRNGLVVSPNSLVSVLSMQLNFARMRGFQKVEVCVDSRAVYSGIHNNISGNVSVSGS
jgi:hypothetical protein